MRLCVNFNFDHRHTHMLSAKCRFNVDLSCNFDHGQQSPAESQGSGLNGGVKGHANGVGDRPFLWLEFY